jgi:hypothetical protein
MSAKRKNKAWENLEENLYDSHEKAPTRLRNTR